MGLRKISIVLTISQYYDIINSEREEIKMKITDYRVNSIKPQDLATL